MGRFSRLEFGDSASRREESPGEPVRDAAYFHKEALKYWLAGDYELALRHYSRMLEREQTRFEGWAGQVLMLIELGEYREANLWADKALGSFPEHPELLALKAVACARDARMEQAVAYSDNSIAQDNPTPRVWLARAEVFLDRRGPVSESCLSKAVGGAGEGAAIIKLEAGRLLQRKRNFVLALQYLRDTVQMLPRSALAWYELGRCQAALGQPEAVHSFEQSLRLRPGWREPGVALRRFENRGFFRRLLGK
jgi:tetratricopeptide (TPR) repeat protein